MFDAELERTSGIGADELRSRDCLLRYYDYRRVFGAAQHAAALDCFERVTAREPTAETWAGLALLLADAWAHGFAGQGGNAAVLERARYANYGYPVHGANLRSDKLKLMRDQDMRFFSTLDAQAIEARNALLAKWK